MNPTIDTTEKYLLELADLSHYMESDYKYTTIPRLSEKPILEVRGLQTNFTDSYRSLFNNSVPESLFTIFKEKELFVFKDGPSFNVDLFRTTENIYRQQSGMSFEPQRDRWENTQYWRSSTIDYWSTRN